MLWTRRYLGGCVAALLLAAPASADLLLGDQWQNPALALAPPHYTAGLPTWFDATPADSLTSAIFPPSLGTPFVGTVLSEVHFVNGVDSSGGLGFVYRFALDPAYTADGLESASFAPAQWAPVGILDAGAGGSGTSTPEPAPSVPPVGFTTWADGKPYTILRDGSTGAPEIRWTGDLGGTTINGGQLSSLIWFETDATDWTESVVTLLDGGVGGSARILSPGTVIPEPGTTVLGLIGLVAVSGLRRQFATAR